MTTVILAVLVDQHGARSCLEAAFAAAGAIGDASVAALHVRIDPHTTILPTEEMLTDPRRREIEDFEERERQALRSIFSTVSEALSPSAFLWIDEYGTEKKGVPDHARDARLIVMAVPEQHYAGHAQEAMHAALFDAERPLLLVPRGYRHRSIRRVVVAWHDDASCRRAIEGATPWLKGAQTVRVISIDGGDAGALEPARTFMQNIEIDAIYEAIDRGASSRGECLLDAAVEADWLVMGAHRRGRLVEMLVGSTADIVTSNLTLPVLFMH